MVCQAGLVPTSRSNRWSKCPTSGRRVPDCADPPDTIKLPSLRHNCHRIDISHAERAFRTARRCEFWKRLFTIGAILNLTSRLVPHPISPLNALSARPSGASPLARVAGGPAYDSDGAFSLPMFRMLAASASLSATSATSTPSQRRNRRRPRAASLCGHGDYFPSSDSPRHRAAAHRRRRQPRHSPRAGRVSDTGSGNDTQSRSRPSVATFASRAQPSRHRRTPSGQGLGPIEIDVAVP